jgi:hypothetical protein
MKLMVIACVALFASLVFTGFAFLPDRKHETSDRQRVCRLTHDQFIDTCGTDGPLNPQ